MANDHLNVSIDDAISPLDRVVSAILGLIPAVEANRVTSYVQTMARSVLMFTRFVEPRRNLPNFFDAYRLFEDATSLPLETFFVLLFASLSRFGKPEKIRESTNFADFAIPPTWFSSTKVPTENIQSFLAAMSHPIEELAQNIVRTNPGAHNFVLLKDKPLVSDGVGYFPIDFDFLTEKFYSGVFWSINSHLPNERRKNFHAFWGEVFEDYLNWLLSSSCSGKANRFYKDPRYENNPEEQVCDGLIVCDRTAILIEYKGSTFRATSKYGESFEQIKHELEEKLVEGTPDSKKGVKQLIPAVERLCRRENPDSIRSVDLSFVTTVLPLIIIRDELGSTPGLGMYLNSRFQEMKPKRLFRAVLPLFCLSANDMERLTPYLIDVRLDKILLGWQRQDKGLFKSFGMVDHREIDSKGDRRPEFMKLAFDWLKETSALVLGLQPQNSERADPGASEPAS